MYIITQAATDFLAFEPNALTHGVRIKMATILQTTFSNAFSWMKTYEFCLKIGSN